jgi:TusA-related sulfurtransferase
MQSIDIDARGLSCPQPVIETKKVLDKKPDAVTVQVDNVSAKENVSRYAKAAGYQVTIEGTEYGWALELSKA